MYMSTCNQQLAHTQAHIHIETHIHMSESKPAPDNDRFSHLDCIQLGAKACINHVCCPSHVLMMTFFGIIFD